MSARYKLMLSIGALIAAIIGILSLLSYYEIKASSTQDYREKLSNKSFLIAKAVEGKIDSYFIALQSLSHALEVQQGHLKIDDKAIRLLVNNKEKMQVLNVFIGLPNGVTYSASNQGEIPNFNAKKKQREWFSMGMSGADRSVTKPFNASTGDLTMVIVMPMKSNGKILGLLGISLKMNDITKYVHDLTSDPSIFVAREDGFLMAADKATAVGKNLFELYPSYREFADKSKSEHTYRLNNGDEYYVISSKIESLRWTVWAWATWDDINATSLAAVKTNVISGFIFIIIGVLILYYLITKLMYVPIGGEPKEIEALVNKIAGGDLTEIPKLDEKSMGVYRSIITMATNLKGSISDITQSSSELLEASALLGAASAKVDSSSKSQMLELEQVATAMNEMTATVAEVAQNAVEASQSSNKANESSKIGLKVVASMNADITQLVADIGHVQEVISSVHKETENVGGILDVIRGIADQTNLLALNAAIEAARAGDQGRGFAVVADEVRTLATKTQESTNEIQSMILALQEQASRSVTLMIANASSAEETRLKAQEASSSLAQIETEIQLILDMNDQIATASEQQSQVSSEINENVVNVNDLVASTASDVQKNVQTAEKLNAMAISLKEAISIFKI
ncbi:methyl-accepting chemotaxis protein [Psychromonas sp. CNPT3]|uniref:methyl-accepting chemotaxis protein n=1 Tax=Psychromonas sp. CNPT3 TaxID=314282 RepID=UPI00006E485B|nr:methyl-accepting chemotaxis protein [Psychromonas sp. CNPT3]AGH82505.1 methyl-accepting chemotaxis protein [Psychromonas sp. CNPT3]